MPMKKNLLYGLLIISSLTLVSCSSTDASKGNISTSKIVKKSANKMTKDEKMKNSLTNVKVGDFNKDGKAGTSKDEVVKLLGKETSVTKNDTVETLIWKTGKVRIDVGFMNNKVVSKTITGFLYKRDKVISLDDFDAIKTNTSYEIVTDKYGQPDELATTVMNGNELTTGVWYSNIKGENDKANMTLNFTDGKLTQKNQVGIK
ncbi:putative lipoprotein [Streptococcus porcinus]|uniref:Putative lipoprotein n=2 Tax=Streptococcus porcinus TaxID=1340 RepID=A0A4V6LY69_STRPO|nr:putative lipoprotein [Streptococcus porcinus]VTT44599.1 putative lipoprotein [Streptococcus porcinus]